MKNIITLSVLFSFLSLSGCATDNTMKFSDLSPRSITITNIVKSERVQARRSAEKHCAKYFKVVRVIKSEAPTEDTNGMMTIECIKPNQQY